MTTLVIAAHPDDEVLGCGGTIARLAREGETVFMALLGEGITSRYSQREQANPSSVSELLRRSEQVAKLLGAKDLFTFSLPDNRFDTLPLLDVVKIIEQLIAKLKPLTVYTQHGGDLNVDHAVTFRATLTATRPTVSCPVKVVHAFEVASSSEWAFQQFNPVFAPNVFVDISQTLELKIKAMQIYESETRPFPHPRSSEAMRAAAMRWGSVSGLAAAEAFACIRDIR